LARVLLEPASIGRAAGVIDDLHFRTQRKRLCNIVGRIVRDQCHDVGIETRFGQDVACDLHGNRQRKNGAGMRFHDDRIAGRETCEQSRVSIPRRECRTTDDERDAARHDPIPLFHLERIVFALRLFPLRGLRHAAHLVPGIGDGFESAILRVRTAGLERHQKRLTRRMHHGIGDQEAFLVDPRERLEAHANPDFRPRFAPFRACVVDRCEQRVDIGFRIRDSERHPVG
jgi:hypothetical protein